MSKCLDCEITRKLGECCGAHPVTLEKQALIIEEHDVEACPNLNAQGLCRVYAKRPDICKSYQCSKLLEPEAWEIQLSAM